MTTPSPTRLYYDDAYCLTFESAVSLARHRDGRCEVTLDSSPFYPTSGGQLHDTGTLMPVDAGTAIGVVDVREGEDGLVWHVLDGDLTPGTMVVGMVDRGRRADHREQHSGQHVLSASFASIAHAETRSVHLGSDLCTLDLDRDVGDEALVAVEAHANAVVRGDRPVLVRYVDAADAATLPLRRPTGRTGIIRLVDIEGHDLSACGGTHVARTGEIGAIFVRGVERFKGGTRVTFVCGGRAVSLCGELRRVLDAVARQLSVGMSELPVAIARLHDEGRELRKAHEAARARLAGFDAAALESRFESVQGCAVLVTLMTDTDAASLRRLASMLVESPGRLVVLLGGDAPHALIVARSADQTTLDAGQLARALAVSFGGKAGGRPDFAQGGGLVADVGDVRALVLSLIASPAE